MARKLSSYLLGGVAACELVAAFLSFVCREWLVDTGFLLDELAKAFERFAKDG